MEGGVTMRVLGMGLDWKGKRLYEPIEESAFTEALLTRLSANTTRGQGVTRAATRGAAYREETRRRVVDKGDPRAAGWSILVSGQDPRKDAILEALAPLAKARGMASPAKPLLFSSAGPDDWQQWLTDHYYALDLAGQQVPGYVLIVGGPEQVPFGFQSLMDSVASVGRLEFAQIEDLAVYAAKLLRLEAAPDPVVAREALFFATDAGPKDPTYFSRKYMAEPLAAHVRDDLKFKTTEIFGDVATKANLLQALKQTKAGLVYTASHGLGATSETQSVQTQYNGAICCQCEGQLTLDHLLAADDIPMTEPILEGAVLFQFACFGYGTPAVSEYAHWLPETWGKPQKNAERDFIAALPKRLLAHPRGPIAFIGHLDTAFLHGFADASQPHTLDRWHTRIAPFKKVVDQLLGVQPSGLAMEGINERYSLCNAMLANTNDRVQKGTMNWTDETRAGFLDTWITRGDAQNYLIFGDPAASLRLPA
jgi:hypothetical protein